MEVFLENKLQRGLEQVRRVLETTRSPQLAGEVHHQYSDKYVLAEMMTSAAVASSVGLLRRLGLTEEGLGSLREWGAKRTVTLRLKAEETCTFKEKKTRDVEAATKDVTEVSGLGRMLNVTRKSVTTVTEYFWDVTASYAVTAYCGNDPTTAVELLRRGGATVVMTGTEGSPYPKSSSKEAVEVEVGWLVRQLNEGNQAHFTVNRSDAGCHTPRRNKDVEEALRVLTGLGGWYGSVVDYLQSHLWGMEQLKGAELDLSAASNVASVFVPVVPLLENLEGRSVPAAVEGGGGGGGSTLVVLRDSKEDEEGSLALSCGDVSRFLREEERGLDEKWKTLEKVFPEAKGLVLRADAQAVAALRHGQEVVSTYVTCVNYLERLLRNQLIAAIGKEVSSQDFGNYMRFHNRKLFAEGYGPVGFSHAVRRPEHYPEGVLSIEEARPDGSMSEPIATVVRRITPADGDGDGNGNKMSFSLSASATATFTGDVYVHSHVGHRFSHEPLSKLTVTGRARQFSGFVLLLGRIGGPGLFLPSHAMVIQNKDDFRIPLMLEEIPTPKEFQDAIESLSPEQQRFAKAYRSMQLESTLFAMCVVQIKPQLEKVLNLPEDSLTKEIKLTQDLLELFVKYQIPSDLLSWKCDVFVDPADVPVKEKLDAVKGHVAAMQEMLKESKEKEIKEASLEFQYAHGGLPPPPPPVSMQSAVPCSAPMAMMQCAPMAGGGPPPPPGGMLRRAVPSPKPQAVAVVTRAESQPAQTSAKGTGETAQSTPKGRGEEEVSEVSGFDVSQIPQQLEKKYAELDEDSALRPTIINVGKSWEKEHQEGLLSKPKTTVLGVEEQKAEKDKAFDLLDALTKSGVVPIDDATLHVVVTATHCFDKTLMDTVVQKSVNPVEKLERSVLIVSTTIHDKPAEELVKGAQRERVKTYSPKLFLQ